MKISINSVYYPVDQIISDPPPVRFTDFERHTWVFIQEWLNGADTFRQKTSGSTGEPKEILLERKKMQISAGRTCAFFDLKQGDSLLVCIPTTFIGGKMMLVRALENRMNIMALEPSSGPFKGLRQKIGFAAMIPLQMAKLLNDPEGLEWFSDTKGILLGGASVSTTLERLIEKIAVPVFEAYGMTETVSHIALRRLNGTEKQQVFHTLPGTTVSLSEGGCLVVHSDVAIQDPLITNDLAEVIGPTMFRVLGRADQVINSGGIKINLTEVEDVLEQYLKDQGFTNRFFCAGIPDESLGEKLVLIIEGPDGMAIPDIGKSGITDKHKIPKEVFFLGRFVETPTSKIQRKASLAEVLRHNAGQF